MMEDDEIVRTILTLGRNLGLKVVAEGVETIEQVEKLQELGCEFAQGYYFSVPVNAQEATDLLAARYHWPTTKPGRSNLRPCVDHSGAYRPVIPDFIHRQLESVKSEAFAFRIFQIFAFPVAEPVEIGREVVFPQDPGSTSRRTPL